VDRKRQTDNRATAKILTIHALEPRSPLRYNLRAAHFTLYISGSGRESSTAVILREIP
jgi:hypothetical protein